jgi:hypothetical protein
MAAVTTTLTGTPARATPALRVVNSDATPEEIAAVVVAIASLQTPITPVRTPLPGWSDSTRQLRRTMPHGPDGWRTSALPR